MNNFMNSASPDQTSIVVKLHHSQSSEGGSEPDAIEFFRFYSLV